MAEKLGPRQAAILRAIVREFVRSGEPVGSKHLVDRSRLDVSPATVRNEMARLEELGYVTQPHTSAGRIPTDAGYRFVVDELKPRALGEGQQRALAESLGDEPASVEDLLRRATEVVSRFTRHASAVLAQRARSTTLRRLEVIPIGSRAATVIAIAENGRVEQRMVHADHELTPADVEELCARLNRDHGGSALEDVLDALDALSPAAGEAVVVEGVRDAIAGLAAAAEHVFVGGVANLASETDFERDALHRLYEELDRQTSVLEILASALDDDPVTVRIGSELASEPFQHCSIVIARFGAGGDATGSVSVIGPMRMDYERVIATANGVARLLETSLGPQDQ